MLQKFRLLIPTLGLLGVAVVIVYFSAADMRTSKSVHLPAISGGHSGTDAQSIVDSDLQEQQDPLRRQFDDYVAQAASLGSVPVSFAGTEVDGQLRVDARGQLLVTPDVRLVFDYFLAALGEESLQQIQARIAQYLSEQLPDAAALEAWDLLQRYLNLREAMVSMPDHDGTPEGMRAAIRTRHMLQQSFLGVAATDAFYGLDMTYDNFMIERQALLENRELPAAEREQQTAVLYAQLPQALQQMLTETQAPMELQQQTMALRESGASDAEVRALREASFGVEAADRFDKLDEQRALWDSRYDSYLAQRAELLNSGLSAEDQMQALEKLQQRLFEEFELPRVAALDRIGSAQSAAR